MPTPLGRARWFYGARLWHLIVVLGSLALAGYAVAVLGVSQLFNPTVWWQSIAVWFAVAIIGHDLILFPLYAFVDRLLPRRRHTQGDRDHSAPTPSKFPPVTNYLRMPTLAAGLLLLLFFPGIIEQGEPAYNDATGLTQAPFLDRWLLITAALYLTSAVCYVVKTVLQHRNSADSASSSPPEPLRPPVPPEGAAA